MPPIRPATPAFSPSPRLLAALAFSFAFSFASPLALAQIGGAGGVTQVWIDNCAKCHSEQGQGGGAGTATLLTDDLFDAKHDRRFFDAIKKGVPNHGMDAFGETMNDAKIWALVVHIRELQMKDWRDRHGSPTPRKPADTVFKTQRHSFRVETVIEKGLSVPWAVDFYPAKSGGPVPSMLVTERSGGLRVYENGKLSDRVEGTPKVYARGQGGMMEVALHPDFATNGWVYLSFSDPVQGENRTLGSTKIVRGKIVQEGDKRRWTDEQTIFEAKKEHHLNASIHFGSRIAFDPPGKDGKRLGHIYFTIGEHGYMEYAQNLGRQNGKVHRLNDDGSVPSDNPFANAPTDGDDFKYRSIWSYGHRNPQGLVFDLAGNLWDTEHCMRGGDELNLIRKGGNYGWPLVAFGINYNDSPFKTPWPEMHDDAKDKNIVMPTLRWLPSIATCGLDVVRPGPLGEAFPKWKGDLLAGGLAAQTIQRVRVDGDKVVETEEIFHGRGRVRDISTGPDGSIYITLNEPDQVVRLVPAE